MLTLRIYNGDVMLRELAGVKAAGAEPSGALLCELLAAQPPFVQSVVFAPGTWTEVEQWQVADELLANAVEPERVTLPAAITDGMRVHEAMSVVCTCAELRCPLVLNAASATEKRWWRIRQYGSGDMPTAGAPAPAPYQQCSHERDHDPNVIPHEWLPGGWPYGPAQHHRQCPRHPDNYNRPHGEGQPQHAAGVTSADVVPAPSTPAPTGQMIRPYVDPQHAAPPTDDDDTATMPAVNAGARASWAVCGVIHPEQGPTVFCGWQVGHAPDIGHRYITPGGSGEVIRWE